MRSHGRLLVSIWNDADFRSLNVDAQRMYCALLSQKDLTNCGVQPLMTSKWAKYSPGTTEDDIYRSLNELEAARFIAYDTDTDEVLIRTFIRNDGVAKQPNVFKSALKLAGQIESPRLRKITADELRKLDRGDAAAVAEQLDDGTVREPFQNPSRTLPEGFPEPFPNPSGTLSEPYAPNEGDEQGKRNPSRTLPEPFAYPCGEGVGEGVTPSSRDGYGGGSRVRTHAREAARPTDPDPESDRHEDLATPGAEPPARCAKHRDVIAHPDPPPCGPCANFRKAHERWTARQAVTAAERRSTEARQRAEVRAAAIRSCSLCDDTGYRHGRVCDHDPSSDDRTRRGIALVRAALTKPDAHRPDDPDREGG